MKKIWKDIFENYQVSNYGEVKSLNYNHTGKEKILKQHILKNTGYKVVPLFIDKRKKTCYVHKLVAMAFIPNLENKSQVNHIDGNKLNNSVENLEWCTHSENQRHAFKNQLHKTKSIICVETGIEYLNGAEIQRKLNICRNNVTDCCNGNRKTAGGYHWKYKD